MFEAQHVIWELYEIAIKFREESPRRKTDECIIVAKE